MCDGNGVLENIQNVSHCCTVKPFQQIIFFLRHYKSCFNFCLLLLSISSHWGYTGVIAQSRNKKEKGAYSYIINIQIMCFHELCTFCQVSMTLSTSEIRVCSRKPVTLKQNSLSSWSNSADVKTVSKGQTLVFAPAQLLAIAMK